ncbi:MAG: hypothetical protein MI742_03725 [Desulfobacterales bacterium]|nr:hypothetical protein [Desulfobacterales bacterium]
MNQTSANTITVTNTTTHRELEILTGPSFSSVFVENSTTGQETYSSEEIQDARLRSELQSAIDRVFEIAGRISGVASC